MADLPKGKPILCVDFDGVIHSYSSGWKGPRDIPDPPVPGAMEFLRNMTKEFDVQIYSSRSRYWFGRHAIKVWLRRHLFEYVLMHMPNEGKAFDHYEYFEDIQRVADEIVSRIKFPVKKPAAFLQIDDRAICFMGKFPSIDKIKAFKPWNKK